jgi:HK97 family phage portal protein
MTDMRWWRNAEYSAIRNDEAQAAVVTTASSPSDLADFFGYASANGLAAVNPRSAMLVPAVYRACAVIGGSIGQLPVTHYSINSNDERVDLGKTDLWWLLNEQPDPLFTSTSAWEWTYLGNALRGDSFWIIERNRRAEPTGFKILHPDQVTVLRRSGRLRYGVYHNYFEDDQQPDVQVFDQDDILHFPGFGFDGRRSPSVISSAAKAGIGSSLTASDFMAKTIAGGALPKVAIEMVNRYDASRKAEFRESFDKTYGQGNGRKYPLVLDEGAKVRELSISPVDLQLLETRKFDSQAIATSFGVPPIFLGDSDKVSSWGTGIEQMKIGFQQLTLLPIGTRYEEELNRKLFRRAGQFLAFDFDQYTRGDSAALANFYKAALGGPGNQGWMTVDEVRKRQFLKPKGMDIVATPSKDAKSQETNEGNNSNE